MLSSRDTPDIAVQPANANALRAIINFPRKSGIVFIAAGVETQVQRSSKPLSADNSPRSTEDKG